MENYVILGGFKMSTVSRISKSANQKGGYLKPSQFETKIIDDGVQLMDMKFETIHYFNMGMVVEYLTRLEMGVIPNDVFTIAKEGILNAFKHGFEDAINYMDLISNIKKGLDDQSIINACTLTTFDTWCRNFFSAMKAASTYSLYSAKQEIIYPNKIYLDTNTIKNIRTMVQRSINFWKIYGPIIETGFTFKKEAFTNTVTDGEGDFLTKDTIWDYKVSKNKLTTQQTLQLLMYWIIGQHDGSPKYKNIKKLGIFNPRLNIVYTLNVSQIPAEIIEAVEKDVICYEK